MSETLHFRIATPDDVAEVARLVQHSFPGVPRTFEKWVEQLSDPIYGGGPEIIVLAVEGSSIIGSIQIHPLEQWIAGKPFPMCGIGTVTVSPTHRKQRIAGRLMEAAMRIAGSRGDLVSGLYPFRASFYQSLGYGAAGEAHQFQVPPSALPDSPHRHHVEVIDTDAGRAEVLDFYNGWVHSQTGQITRTERTFRNICSVHDRALFAWRNPAGGKIEGYAFATYRTDLPRRDRFLEVDELVWSSDDARRGLYGWLSTMGDQWEQITLRSLPSHRLGDWIREPRMPHAMAPLWLLWSPAATLMMGPMFRLLHAEKAFERRSIAAGPAMRIALRVHDAQLGINDGEWRLDLVNGAASMTPAGTQTSASPACDADIVDVNIVTDISTLSRLFISSLRATDAHAAGLLQCDTPERLRVLDDLLALPEPWTFDRY